MIVKNNLRILMAKEKMTIRDVHNATGLSESNTVLASLSTETEDLSIIYFDYVNVSGVNVIFNIEAKNFLTQNISNNFYFN